MKLNILNVFISRNNSNFDPSVIRYYYTNIAVQIDYCAILIRIYNNYPTIILTNNDNPIATI